MENSSKSRRCRRSPISASRMKRDGLSFVASIMEGLHHIKASLIGQASNLVIYLIPF